MYYCRNCKTYYRIKGGQALLFAVYDFTAIKRIATAYMKLLFPHWVEEKDVNLEEFDTYCLQPAVARRRIIIEQCQLIDPEYSVRMPNIHVKGVS